MTEFKNEYTWGSAVRNESEEEFHASFDAAVEAARHSFGKKYPAIIRGEKIYIKDTFQVRSPADSDILLAEFPRCTTQHIEQAVKSARTALEEWSETPYEQRAKIFYECADSFSMEKFYLAALLAFENGKSRIEAMGDIDEAIDFMRFYASELEANEGFCRQTAHPDPGEKTMTVMKPYGVWGIISPFNFPSAIAIGMASGALLAGNTAILKPASAAPLSSFQFANMMHGRLPGGALNFVPGSGSILGQALIQSSDVDGIAFTGSKQVGRAGFKEFTALESKPFISEMGGKNPVIVTRHADIAKAAQGVANAAFGFGGQKCSACSRAYVHEDIYDEFARALIEKTQSLKIGLPWRRQVFMGPVIDGRAKSKFADAVNLARSDGKILAGGSVLEPAGLERGHFVEPTIVSGLPEGHKLLQEELFLPILCLAKYADFEDVIKTANRTEYGLTAGIFSEDSGQVDEFFARVQAGVLYANRAASATTAALVSAQPFVGWKGSGSTGKGAGGRQYLQQFMRSQTQTVCR